MVQRHPIIAIDGPAAAGKGTLARRLAEHLDYAYLDTGALYRGVALQVVRSGGEPGIMADAIAAARALNPSTIDKQAIRTAEIGAAAAKVAAMGEVRSEILDLQRRFAANPPDGRNGAVLDGRDIGTVVCPDADHKVFVTASAEIRAHRRWLELREKNPQLSESRVLADLKERDRLDAERPIAPLKPAEDALLLDTTELSIEEAFETALALMNEQKA
ncbi:MAG: (d)CMP kinase [Parvibaculales bacterium]